MIFIIKNLRDFTPSGLKFGFGFGFIFCLFL
jgi:hypothetical protein